MKKNKNLAVIISVHRISNLLIQTLGSLLRQPLRDFLTVVVLDGSLEGIHTLAPILEKEQDSVVVLFQEHAGASAARNKGIAYVMKQSIPYIAFLDADDIWTDAVYSPDTAALLEESNADIIQFGYCYGNENLDPVCQYGIHEIKSRSSGFKLHTHISSAFYKTDLIRKNRILFPEGIGYREDVAFRFLTGAYAEHIICIDKFLFIKRNDSKGRGKKRLGMEFVKQEQAAWNYVRTHLSKNHANESLLKECEALLWGCD